MNLLLIDDDEVDRAAVLRALRKSLVDCEIAQASTAAHGLTLAAEQQFDAILLDYRLPDMDGLAVLRALRGEKFEHVAVVMLSRIEDDGLAEQCLEMGAQDFLLKDEVNGRRLSRAVRHARQRFSIESELRSSREQLRYLSESDPLTGLTNRRGFESALTAAINRSHRDHDCLAVLLIDLDDFKSVNDTLGHGSGDELLVDISRRLSASMRDGEHLFRLGGDEFVVLMTHCGQDGQAMVLADRILLTLQEPICVNETEQSMSASIGIALLDSGIRDPMDILKCADIAMYQAKQDGRNCSRLYSTHLQEVLQKKADIKNDLKKALLRGEFSLHYQAMIHAVDGSLAGMEALLRWNHPRLGMLSPDAFMSVAEHTGAIIDIGKWVLHEACCQRRQWQAQYPALAESAVMAINLSASQIKHSTLVGAIQHELSSYALKPGMLELEITESALIQDASAMVTTLSNIADLGVSFSLDDFGTGYSSLEHLRLFPIEVLKIDKGFVAAIGRDTKGECLLTSIIVFARALGMKVVAEGVETAQQAQFCTEHGCHVLQGYFYSRPIAAHAFAAAFLHEASHGQQTASS